MHVLPGVTEVVCLAVPILSDTSVHPFVLVGIEGAALGSRSLKKGRQLTQGWSFLGSSLAKQCLFRKCEDFALGLQIKLVSPQMKEINLHS